MFTSLKEHSLTVSQSSQHVIVTFFCSNTSSAPGHLMHRYSNRNNHQVKLYTPNIINLMIILLTQHIHTRAVPNYRDDKFTNVIVTLR